MISDNRYKTKIPASSIPVYQRVEEDIREKVRDGRLPSGMMLAGRHNLAKEYGVSLSSVQQAIANLIADGTLETFDRRGTFVARTSSPAEDKNGLHTPHLNENGNGSSTAESAPASSVSLPDWRTTATLGIVATARIDSAVSADIGSLWSRLVIRSLEHFFSTAGGATRFYDRYPDYLGPYDRGFDDVNAIPLTDAIAALKAEGAEAFAIVGLCDSRDMSDEVVAAVDVEHIPTVYISWHEIRPPLSQVYYDNRFAGYQAAQHLLKKGYERLVFLAPFTESWLSERIQGAADAVRHKGLPEDTLRIYPSEPLEGAYYYERIGEHVYALARQAFADPSLSASTPIAFIAPNDYTAYSVFQAATELGKTAGTDFGLIGFDDDFRSCAMGLTTVRPPIEAMGEEAGQLLLRALQGKTSGSQVRLRSHVIPRASTSFRPGV